jgi:hypothetical protein
MDNFATAGFPPKYELVKLLGHLLYLQAAICPDRDVKVLMAKQESDCLVVSGMRSQPLEGSEVSKLLGSGNDSDLPSSRTFTASRIPCFVIGVFPVPRPGNR